MRRAVLRSTRSTTSCFTVSSACRKSTRVRRAADLDQNGLRRGADATGSFNVPTQACEGLRLRLQGPVLSIGIVSPHRFSSIRFQSRSRRVEGFDANLSEEVPEARSRHRDRHDPISYLFRTISPSSHDLTSITPVIGPPRSRCLQVEFCLTVPSLSRRKRP